MKKIAIATTLVLAAGAASAEGWYGGVSLDQKDKLDNSNNTTGEYHNVFAMTIGKKLGDGYSVEGLIEDEQVHSTVSHKGKHEGLYQLRGNKDFDTGTMFTPYVGLAGGVKSKSNTDTSNGTLDFPFYRYDIGVKAKLNDMFSVRLGWRHRQAVNDTFDGTATKWNTDETTLALGYKLTDVDTITVAYKMERSADKSVTTMSEYNTTAISYTRAF